VYCLRGGLKPTTQSGGQRRVHDAQVSDAETQADWFAAVVLVVEHHHWYAAHGECFRELLGVALGQIHAQHMLGGARLNDHSTHSLGPHSSLGGVQCRADLSEVLSQSDQLDAECGCIHFARSLRVVRGIECVNYITK